MIILKNMKWDNWYSYGENNYIDFENSNLTQIIGKNGDGKTSIIHIVEEVIYNKNSKGIKKSDIINRYKDYLSAELNLGIDGVEYTISIYRKSTLKVTLLRNGECISSHTATNTFKDIQKLIGMDFNTFSQLVYQNSKQGLDFLTSADSSRKKFLISLFKLDRYTEYFEKFKKLYNDANLNLKKLEGKQSVLLSWLSSHADVDLTLVELKPEVSDKSMKVIMSGISKLKDELHNIDSLNKVIIENNKIYNNFIRLEKPDPVPTLPLKDTLLSGTKAVLEKDISDNKKLVLELNKLSSSVCGTCKQHINEDIKATMLVKAKDNIEKDSNKLQRIKDSITKYNKEKAEYDRLLRLNEAYDIAKSKVKEDPKDILDKDDINNDIKKLEQKYTEWKKEFDDIITFNKDAIDNNSRVKTLLIEFEKHRKDTIIIKSEIDKTTALKTKFEVLKTVFSTKGLVSYKIDYLVNGLEDKINEYLVELSDGRFQLNFILQSDSINIAIIDNGTEVNINALSTGELSRVNVATLLAIRSIMSSISNTKINLLYLDEILGVLDDIGKSNLIELLLDEKELNTFIVSHEYTHPLLDKLTLHKIKGVSVIDK